MRLLETTFNTIVKRMKHLYVTDMDGLCLDATAGPVQEALEIISALKVWSSGDRSNGPHSGYSRDALEDTYINIPAIVMTGAICGTASASVTWMSCIRSRCGLEGDVLLPRAWGQSICLRAP